MRNVGLSAAVLGAVIILWPIGSTNAQAEVQPSSSSYCVKNADKGNRPPTASVRLTPSSVGANAKRTVAVEVIATDPDKDNLSFSHTVSGGRYNGQGPTGVWDLSGVNEGTYSMNILIDDGGGCFDYISTSVEVGS